MSSSRLIEFAELCESSKQLAMAISSLAFLFAPVAAIVHILVIMLPSTTSAAGSSPNILLTGDILYSGESLRNHNSKFTMKEDCNLVLNVAGKWVFQSRTAGWGFNCTLSLNDRGQLLIRDNSSRTVWTTSAATTTIGPFVAVLRDDNALAIYGTRVWWSNDRPRYVPATGSFTWNNVLYAGEHAFVFHPTGQAVIYGPVVWTAGLDSGGACETVASQLN